MDRLAIREFLRSRRRQRHAALAIKVSPQHLGGFLKGHKRSNLSAEKLLALVDHLRSEYGLEIELEPLVREVSTAQADP